MMVVLTGEARRVVSGQMRVEDVVLEETGTAPRQNAQAEADSSVEETAFDDVAPPLSAAPALNGIAADAEAFIEQETTAAPAQHEKSAFKTGAKSVRAGLRPGMRAGLFRKL